MTDEQPAPSWLAELSAYAEQVPMFIARPIVDLAEDYYAHHPRLALYGLCELGEALVKTLAMAASADFAAHDSTRVPPEWLAKTVDRYLLVPTFGSWWRALQDIAARMEHDSDKWHPLIPELSTIVGVLKRELFSHTVADDVKERSNIIALRNSLAHGLSGVSKDLARELLNLWGPRLCHAAKAASCMSEISFWSREGDDYRRFRGSGATPPLGTPPEAIRAHLASGDVALARGDHVTILTPFGWWGSTNGSETSVSQLYVREGDIGLIYGLFGSQSALQAESEGTLRERLYTRFGLGAGWQARADHEFNERGYEAEFEEAARTFVGRAEALEMLWGAVVTKQRGFVFVSGPAGIGKSQLLARLGVDLTTEVAERNARGPMQQQVLVYRFVHGERGCAPLPLLRWIIERIALLDGEAVHRDKDQDIHALMDSAMDRIAKVPLERLVLVLDGLDELARADRPFVERLVARLARAERVLVVVSTRPEAGLPELIRSVGAVEPWPDGLPPMNAAELREVLVALWPGAARRLVRDDRVEGGEIRNRFIDGMTKRAQGLPLYVRLLLQAIYEPGFDPEFLSFPTWLPASVNAAFEKLVTTGGLSDVAAGTPAVGALLALAREPLSSAQIAALLSGSESEEDKHRFQSRYGVDLEARHAENADHILRQLGGLLRVATDDAGIRRYRLLHDDLTTFVLRSQALSMSCNRMRGLLAKQALNPSGAAAGYLFANGVAHILDGSDDSSKADVEVAASCLCNIDYQVARLQALASSGGDGGIRDDWALLADVQIDVEQDAWRHFWTTEGTALVREPGGDGAREFVELALSYSPDTAVGAAVTRFLPERGV